MQNMVIGIEGYVGAGKTSICKELLEEIPNSIILHGGNLYRAIVYGLMTSGIELAMLKEHLHNVDIKKIMDMLKVQIALENRETVIYLDGVKIEEEKLQNTRSSLAVSTISNVADNSQFFSFARELIEQFKKQYNIICSGRALMQIYPDLDYHFLITASLEERVKRKYIQYKGKVPKEEVRENIIQRDDVQEKSGYYKQYPDTILVDVTDCKSAKESCEKVLHHIAVKVTA